MVLLSIFGGITVVSTAIAIRNRAIERRIERLNQPLDGIPSVALANIRWRTDYAAAVAGATVLDVGVALYRIDPQVLDAIDLAHGDSAFANFDALSAHVNNVASRGDAALEGLVSQYKGSLGELMAAEHFERAGHAVELADAPNQVGWDLLVDGEPWQVKAGLNEDAIHAAQAAHPDIDIIAVNEHAEFAEDAGNIITMDVSGADLTEATAETVEGIEGLSDLGSGIPLFTGAFEGYRNLKAVERGEMKVTEAVERTVVTTGAVAVGASIGGALIPIVGAPLGGWFARMFLQDVMAKPTLSAAQRAENERRKRLRDERVARKKALAQQFRQAALPIEKMLHKSLQAWARHVHATANSAASEAWSARKPCERAFRDRVFPRRSVLIAEAANEAFADEAKQFETLAIRFANMTNRKTLVRFWIEPLPPLPGLAQIESEVTKLIVTLRRLRDRYRQLDQHWWDVKRGPREPLVVSREAPDSDTNWATAMGCGVTFFFITVLTSALSAASSTNPESGVQHFQPTLAAPTTDGSAPVSTAENAPNSTNRPATARANWPRIKSSGCRMRHAASLKAPVIRTFPAGTTCKPLDSGRVWSKLQCGEHRGFVHRVCLLKAGTNN